MVDEKPSNGTSQSNGDQSSGVDETIPGGKQHKLPDEPQASSESTTSDMGCTAAKSTDSISDKSSTGVEEKPTTKGVQKTTDTYVDRNQNTADNTLKNNQNRSPKRTSLNDDDDDNMESNKRPKSGQSGSVTRSSASLPPLRDTFNDSEDEDNTNSRYYSWAKEDISDYRNNYPNARSNSKIKDNYKFYTNQIPSHPDGDYIDNIHKNWLGEYRHLEYHHGYIQWLFPLQEKGLNWSAEPLQKHEIELIKNDPLALKRILLSYKLMLDFYGFELVDEKTGKLRRLRNDAYKERFRNLNTSSHNYLRITRILKCLGEFHFEYLKFPFLEAVLRECITENTLGNCLRSCKDYWIETLRSREERRAIRLYARELIEYRNKGISPPKSHCANRPTPTAATTTKIGKMSLSANDGNTSN